LFLPHIFFHSGVKNPSFSCDLRDQLYLFIFTSLLFSSVFLTLYNTQSLSHSHSSLISSIFTKLMDFDSSVKTEIVDEETVMMEYDEENNQLDVEFCPVEHPVEPEEEDRPVKCPVPISSSLTHNSTEKTKPDWVKHRASSETPVYPPPRHVRNVRKRHNSFVEGNNSFFTRSMISTSHLQSHDDETTSRRSNVTIFRVLQQVHEFEP
ncbi:unnamed protein product, partial [Thlaspi arvense]